MKTKVMLSMFMAAGLGLVGCGEKTSSNDEGSEAGEDPTTGEEADGDGGSGGLPGDGAEEGEAGDTAGDSGGESGDDAAGFIQDPDGGGVSVECSVFEQDCPEGEKCMPWANDGGSSWNATKCSPLDPSPAQPGDPCLVEGSGVSGVDNCDVASMCWDVDPETNEGTCVDFCTGSAENASCDDPETRCSIANDGVLILCLPTCDPLLQDCPGDGQGCYPFEDAFVCAPSSVAAGDGQYGAACEFLNACDRGFFCATSALVPDCQGSVGCCSEFCDLSAEDFTCMGSGQECQALLEEPIPGTENFGGCGIPM